MQPLLDTVIDQDAGHKRDLTDLRPADPKTRSGDPVIPAQ
jgi:hypothetical protein